MSDECYFNIQAMNTALNQKETTNEICLKTTNDFVYRCHTKPQIFALYKQRFLEHFYWMAFLCEPHYVWLGNLHILLLNRSLHFLLRFCCCWKQDKCDIISPLYWGVPVILSLSSSDKVSQLWRGNHATSLMANTFWPSDWIHTQISMISSWVVYLVY